MLDIALVFTVIEDISLNFDSASVISGSLKVKDDSLVLFALILTLMMIQNASMNFIHINYNSIYFFQFYFALITPQGLKDKVIDIGFFKIILH